ncbi:LmeA family phospholipid-binding protein [Nakamurella leprariae]|uniref:DUF2993 domain-containing protein n=1 Tax=Nakamurella leprariae TaxID=2803911 RepID=A0A939BY16_9ACTN|nr:DUF2993 domain-containing protein [Nakamurella leprariae]MBM9466600.1 DUF2993 domain-containing protein [Nakamurella leprariae]
MKKLVITLVVLAALLVGLDLLGRWFAEREVSAGVAGQLPAGASVDTDIHGFSFLWQAVRGEYPSVTLSADDLTVQQLTGVSATVDLTDVDLPLSGALSGNVDALTAARAAGEAVIPAASVSTATGGRPVGLAPAPSGSPDEVVISTPVEVLGQTVTVSATAGASITDDVLTLRVTQVSAAGTAVPAAVSADLQGSLSLDLSLIGVPFPVTDAGVTARDGDLVITATAEDIRADDLR